MTPIPSTRLPNDARRLRYDLCQGWYLEPARADRLPDLIEQPWPVTPLGLDAIGLGSTRSGLGSECREPGADGHADSVPSSRNPCQLQDTLDFPQEQSQSVPRPRSFGLRPTRSEVNRNSAPSTLRISVEVPALAISMGCVATLMVMGAGWLCKRLPRGPKDEGAVMVCSSGRAA